MTPRDFIKFGELIAQDGNWDDKQLIDKNYVINSTQPISQGDGEHYGMHWAVRKIADDKKLLCMEGFNGPLNPSMHNNFLSSAIFLTAQCIP